MENIKEFETIDLNNIQVNSNTNIKASDKDIKELKELFEDTKDYTKEFKSLSNQEVNNESK